MRGLLHIIDPIKPFQHTHLLLSSLDSPFMYIGKKGVGPGGGVGELGREKESAGEHTQKGGGGGGEGGEGLMHHRQPHNEDEPVLLIPRGVLQAGS